MRSPVAPSACAAGVRIEVVHALADEQHVVPVEVEEGATALAAVQASGILARCPEIDPASLRLGRFGREIARDARLSDGDRIEILRPLVVGPMEARRLRARKRVKSPR
jgi:putative ubiquitin-RnfH superfamily antitoxin RatB of RatAB toxin-antitoxin module